MAVQGYVKIERWKVVVPCGGTEQSPREAWVWQQGSCRCGFADVAVGQVRAEQGGRLQSAEWEG